MVTFLQTAVTLQSVFCKLALFGALVPARNDTGPTHVIASEARQSEASEDARPTRAHCKPATIGFVSSDAQATPFSHSSLSGQHLPPARPDGNWLCFTRSVPLATTPARLMSLRAKRGNLRRAGTLAPRGHTTRPAQLALFLQTHKPPIFHTASHLAGTYRQFAAMGIGFVWRALPCSPRPRMWHRRPRRCSIPSRGRLGPTMPLRAHYKLNTIGFVSHDSVRTTFFPSPCSPCPPWFKTSFSLSTTEDTENGWTAHRWHSTSLREAPNPFRPMSSVLLPWFPCPVLLFFVS
jgi:hypothetical protein